MAADTDTQPPNASPFSRLPRLGFNLGSSSKPGPSSPLRDTPQKPQKEEKEEDWYIPYNGPIEVPEPPPPRIKSAEDRESWGEILNGWLTEDPTTTNTNTNTNTNINNDPQPERQHGLFSARTRVVSNVSHPTVSSGSGNIDPSRRSMGRSRVGIPSFVSGDQGGGIGDVPMPAERSSKYESTIATTGAHTSSGGGSGSGGNANPNRSSLASMWSSLGKKGLSHSVSVDGLSVGRSRSRRERERANTGVSVSVSPTTAAIRLPPSPQRGNDYDPGPVATSHSNIANAAPPSTGVTEDNEYYYSSLLVHHSTPHSPAPPEDDLRSHPYASVTHSPTSPQPRSAPATSTSHKGKARLLDPGKLTITWLDSSRPKGVPDYLKPSPRNSILKASFSTPNLRGIPKGKQRWLSAETWCDALILPRPRFAMRLVEGQGSGRIVSPPESPVWESPGEAKDSRNKFVLTEPPPEQQQQQLQQVVASSRPGSPRKPVPPPSREAEGASLVSPPLLAANKSPEHLKPPRPKSWALDDLALLSPVPSLTQVLAEAEKLEKEREMWRAKATHSFQNKRARSISRARSKSLGASQARLHANGKEGETHQSPSPLGYLAERTLLGSQTVPPKIHIHGPPPPVPKSMHTTTASRTAIGSIFSTHSHSHTGSGSGSGSGLQDLSRATSRARSHAHSNSLGSSEKHSTGVHVHAHGHKRSQSLSKSALNLVKTTANSAAAFCGFHDDSPDLTPLNEKANAIEGALRGSETKHIRLEDQVRRDKENERDDVVVLSPTSLSATRETPDRQNGISPTPSGLSTSGEAVGIALGSPLPSEDHSHEQHHIPSHPYAQGSSYPHRQPIKVSIPDKPASADGLSPSTAHTATSTNRHRQPVLVHPYSQATHPYAAPGIGRPQYVDVPPRKQTESLYAELTPGHVREFDPDEIRYSPYISSQSSSSPTDEQKPEPSQAMKVVKVPRPKTPPNTSDHPYVRNVDSRYSQLAFGDALVRTMHRAGSIDSGFATNEVEDGARPMDTTDSKTELLGDSNSDSDSPPQPELDRTDSDVKPLTLTKRPAFLHNNTGDSGMSSNAIKASTSSSSSSSGHMNPPVFRRTVSEATHGSGASATQANISSGSASGMISHDSSPPLSPRVINDSDDLERYRDLFYKPSSSTGAGAGKQKEKDGSSYERRRRLSGASRKTTSGSITFEVGSHSSRSMSGLTNLARQLSEDMQDLRELQGEAVAEYHFEGGGDASSPMWGSRFGSVRGRKPDDMSDDPRALLSQTTTSTTSSTSPARTNLPLRLPGDIPFVNLSPTANYPEDIGPDEIESSRASSVFEGSSANDHTGNFRIGEVEAVSTPPPMTSPHRISARLSLIIDSDDHNERHLNTDLPTDRNRIVSSQSNLIPSPLSPLTPDAARSRSSYMTSDTGSRMSGLSDFPAPPTLMSHIPISSSRDLDEGNTVTSVGVESQDTTTMTTVPPPLLREPSQDTFGVRLRSDNNIHDAF